MNPYRRRRALLYVPGDDLHKIEKARTLGVDCICLDLEDGVAINQKEAARMTIASVLPKLNFGVSEKLVRINPAVSGLQELDIQSVFPFRPDGVVIPKVEGSSDIHMISNKLSAIEQEKGWIAGSIILIAIAESAKAMLNIREICTSDERLSAVIFGGEDLAVDLNAIRTREAMEIFHVRSELVLQAAAAGIQAIDMVFTDFHDLDWLEKEARQGLEMGFAGKQVIHPNQIEVVQKAFTPTEEEIHQALEIVRVAKENQINGRGAFALDGKMIDMPVVKRARNVLNRAGVKVEN